MLLVNISIRSTANTTFQLQKIEILHNRVLISTRCESIFVGYSKLTTEAEYNVRICTSVYDSGQ